MSSYEITGTLQYNYSVQLQEEILMFDFNAIIAAVGGSLGLFLGFSCLDFFAWIATKMSKAFTKKSTAFIMYERK